MTNAYRDENSIPTLIAISREDGVAVERVLANPLSHGLIVEDGSTGSDLGNNQNNAQKDENNVPVLIATSSADGFTPVEVYVDPDSGALLIDSN